MISRKFHLWESALLLALAVMLTVGMWSSASQSALAGQVLRLHVVAHSDGETDQRLKLAVRDAVLEQAQPLMEGLSDPQAAEQVLLPHLPELARAGQEVLSVAGCALPVSVSVENQWFPTRNYTGFSLPAGTYRHHRGLHQ